MIDLRRLRSRLAASPEREPEVTVVTLPRSRRRSNNGEAVAARRRRRAQQQSKLDDLRPHGWSRADDPDFAQTNKPSFLARRRADGTPLLLFTVLAVLTGVGLARVDSRIEVLQLANEITELSEEQQRLLDRKRRLETERAFLRRPARVGEQARERLGMEPAPAHRIQRIELLPAKTQTQTDPESTP